MPAFCAGCIMAPRSPLIPRPAPARQPALMGDQTSAAGAMQLAIANIGVRTYPNWWFDGEYYTEARDIAGMIAVAGQDGDAPLAGTLLTKLNDLHLRPDDVSTQDKAWLLAAAAALNSGNPVANLTIKGKVQKNLKLPAAFSPSAAIGSRLQLDQAAKIDADRLKVSQRGVEWGAVSHPTTFSKPAKAHIFKVQVILDAMR